MNIKTVRGVGDEHSGTHVYICICEYRNGHQLVLDGVVSQWCGTAWYGMVSYDQEYMYVLLCL